MTVFSAQWQVWEQEFGLTNGLDAFPIGNINRCWRCIGGEVGGRGPAMAVVMACSRVGDGSEVVVVMKF